ncbi:putative asparagine synthase [Mycena polygramma]|nr:putative asparagine synthase [Mycena polygramma]
MCGITAVYYGETVSPPLGVSTLLRASLENIQYRGPDHTGIWVSPDSRVGKRLGHVRLYIIDLETGQQPLADEDELIHCVVTGEIYDHERIRQELEAMGSVFKTKSDSELVVQLYVAVDINLEIMLNLFISYGYKHYGSNLFSNLRGEFAFILYDSTRRVLFAARDRFGIKPLYYTISDGRLLIASEMKAFLPFGWKAEWDIHSVVQNGEFSDDRTVFKGVNKLMAGHFLMFRPTGYLKTQPYWDLTYSASDAPNTETIDEMISNVRSHLFEAIRLRLRSDVPVGVYLSGGIDSSAVAGMAMHLLREENPDAKLATFTLAFPDAGNNDEGPIAHRTAAFIGAEEHMVNITEVELVNVLEETIWHVEQPIWSFHGPGKFLLSRFTRDQGYKVVLSGEGADEFSEDMHGSLSTTSANSILQLARKMLGGISTHRAYAAAGSAGPEVYNSSALAVAGSPDVPRAIAEGIDPRYVAVKTALQQVILNHMGERVEMAHSVEGRPPFLDHHLVNYINTLPPSLKVRPVKGDAPGTWSFTEKWILRQVVKPYVLEELFFRKKLSYNAPPAWRPEGEHGASALVLLQAHLKARVTRATVERVGFFQWSFVEESLASYLAQPNFPTDGALDSRAQLLMKGSVYLLGILEFQYSFNVTYKRTRDLRGR